VEAERDQLLKSLWPRLARHEQGRLIAIATSVTAGRASARTYYASLAQLAEQSYPALQRYLDYLTLSAQLDPAALTEELDTLQGVVEQALFTTDSLSESMEILERAGILLKEAA